jgi:DNA processing protein
MRIEPRDDWVYWMLLAHYASSETRKRFWQERPDDVGQFLREQPDWDALEPRIVQEALTLNLLCEQGGCVLTFAEAAYPDTLRQARDASPPLVLYALGDVGILHEPPLVALAGSRNASERALHEAQRITAELVQEGYHTVTGFARGVDETVAQATLQHGGKTIGVLAQGLLHRLTQQAARAYMHALNDDQLLLLSELHPTTPWSGRFAMMRNRIVAGLADFLIIVEAGAELSQRNGKTVRSGTFECAKIARKLGRAVYALDLPAEGNRQLLAQGIAQCWAEVSAPSVEEQGTLF